MENAKTLRDCIAEYRKANKDLDDKLNKAEESIRETRREQAEQQSRQN